MLLSKPAARQIVVQGDCLAVIRQKPAVSVAVVLASPPYNLGKSYSLHNDTILEAEAPAGQSVLGLEVP
jgi:DNA modification methylase